MFFHLLYIHLFRPFLKYNPTNSPLPSHVSPRKLCSQAAASVSKLMRLYKRTYGLRQICNIAVYIAHSACTIHLLNLPEKTAKRDIIHGVKHLEEIGEDWLCARRTLSILSVLARKWKVNLPEEAATVFARTDAKYGTFSTSDVPSPKQELVVATPPSANASPPRPPTALPTPVAPPQNRIRTQTPLQQSLYSYRPDPRAMNSNSGLNSLPRPPSSHQLLAGGMQNGSRESSYKSNGLVTMSTSSDSLVSSVPYPRHTFTPAAVSASNTPGTELSRNTSGVTSEASGSMTRQVSPNAMFGGVDALVDSQDWWLRDQASLAIGFDNWGMAVNNGDVSSGTPSMNGNTTHRTSDPMAGIGSGFYVQRQGHGGHGHSHSHSQSHQGSDTFEDDDWTSYS